MGFHPEKLKFLFSMRKQLIWQSATLPRSRWPVRARSSAQHIKQIAFVICFFFQNMCHSGGGTGRHAGLKILFAVRRVWVQLPSRVHFSRPIGRFFYQVQHRYNIPQFRNFLIDFILGLQIDMASPLIKQRVNNHLTIINLYQQY